MIKNFSLLILFLYISVAYSQKKPNAEYKAIKVLNLATFHMGKTSDANKTFYDAHNEQNKKENVAIAKLLSEFKPTVILVEREPIQNDKLQKSYHEYKLNPHIKFEGASEIELLAFELGRISDVSRIYGIDHKMEYNYSIRVKNPVDTTTFKEYGNYIQKTYPDIEKKYNKANTLEKLKIDNSPEAIRHLMFINADMLTHVSTSGNFEGADEAAKFYQRNLRIFSNLNQIPLKKDDRVFILMGAAHTGLLNDFISRSPKYDLVNVFDYLK